MEVPPCTKKEYRSPITTLQHGAHKNMQPGSNGVLETAKKYVTLSITRDFTLELKS